MPPNRVSLIWQHNPTVYAPARYRKACGYESYIPAPLAALDLSLGAATAGIVSDAERAIQRLNASVQPALAPLARLLLRTESIASSKVEGLSSVCEKWPALNPRPSRVRRSDRRR